MRNAPSTWYRTPDLNDDSTFFFTGNGYIEGKELQSFIKELQQARKQAGLVSILLQYNSSTTHMCANRTENEQLVTASLHFFKDDVSYRVDIYLAIFVSPVRNGLYYLWSWGMLLCRICPLHVYVCVCVRACLPACVRACVRDSC